MEETAEKRWFVIRVQSGREEQVREALLKRVQADALEGEITNVVIPMEKVTEIRNGRKSVRDRKLFPGYIFVEMVRNDRTWFAVRETPGIGDFLATPMAEHEVARILSTQEEGEEKPRIKIEFKKGETVRIKEGAFENFDGVVEEINPQKGVVRVQITVFGRMTPVEVEYWQLERV